MSNIEFEADQFNNPHYGTSTRPGSGQNASGQRGGMIGWLVSHGIINNDSVAKVVLIGFVCINFLASGLILYFYVLR